MAIERKPGLQAKCVPSAQAHWGGAARKEPVPHAPCTVPCEEELKTEGLTRVTRAADPHLGSPYRSDANGVVHGLREPTGVNELFQDCP